MAKVVLDSSAVLAVVNGEMGAERVLDNIADALICSVNLAEVMSRLVRDGADGDAAKAALLVLKLDVADFDAALAFEAGAMIALTRQAGLSLGDRACLALARREGLSVQTSDRAWSKVDVGVAIELIR